MTRKPTFFSAEVNIKFIKKALADALFPRDFTCDICGVETFDGNLCPQCKKTVHFNCGAVCPECGRRTVRPEICLECKEKPPLFKRGYSALVYDDGAQILISKFKNGNSYLKEYFADLLAAKDLPETDGIIFVPMTKKSERARGYNQGKLLAKSLSERLGVPVLDAFEKIKETKSQKALGFKERKNNLEDSFKVKDGATVKDKTLLLVDDVLTTGATAEELTKIALRAGAKAVYLATVASVEYKIIKKENASDLKKRKKI